MAELKIEKTELTADDHLGKQLADILGLPTNTCFFKAYFHADDGRIEVHYEYYPTLEANEIGKLDSAWAAFKLVPKKDNFNGILTREELT